MSNIENLLLLEKVCNSSWRNVDKLMCEAGTFSSQSAKLKVNFLVFIICPQEKPDTINLREFY